MRKLPELHRGASTRPRPDGDKRRVKMEKVQSILQADAAMSQPVWVPKLTAARDKIRNLAIQPALYHQFHRIWLDT